jgi:hypothetical protein
MTTEEAKFRLSAYRPDGRDAADPFFSDALGQARSEPDLAAWFAREKAFDAGFAERLGGIAPPHGLRESILAGVRASQPRKRGWINPIWLIAACLALLASAGIGLRMRGAPATESDLAHLALRDLEDDGADHDAHAPSMAAVQAELSSHPLPIYRNLAVDTAQLQQDHCRKIRIAGHEVFEICFQRGDVWYHLYVARIGDFAPSAPMGTPTFVEQSLFAAAAWTDGQRTYALVTGAGPAALRAMFGS